MCSCITQKFAKTFCVRDLLGSVVRSRRGADSSRGEPQDGPCSGVTSQFSSPITHSCLNSWGGSAAPEPEQFPDIPCQNLILSHWGHATWSSTPVALKSLKNKSQDILLLLLFPLHILIHVQKSSKSWHLWTTPGVILLSAAPGEDGCNFREKAWISFGISDPDPNRRGFWLERAPELLWIQRVKTE